MDIREVSNLGFTFIDRRSGYCVSFKDEEMERPFKLKHLQSGDWEVLKEGVYRPEFLTFNYIKENCTPGETYFVTDRGSSPRLYVGFTRSGRLVTDVGSEGHNTRAWREVEVLNWRVASEVEMIKLGLYSELL